jgi:transposase
VTREQKEYTQELRNTIVELYNSGMSLADLRREYGVSKSTITG